MTKRVATPIRVGIAGWDYQDWRGVVYPAPRPAGFDPLEYLTHFIDLIEINSTFYRPAKAAIARRWVQRVADAPNFRFAAKLWRRFTHERDTSRSRVAAPPELVREYSSELRAYVRAEESAADEAA